MIEILIDGQSLDIDQTTEIAITYAVADITDPDSSSSGYSKTIEVPCTDVNRKIMQHTNEVFSLVQFNNEQHIVEIIVDDNIVMEGVATLERYTAQYRTPTRFQSGVYHISIVGSAYEWTSQLSSQINELTSTEVVNYTLPNVYANSVNTSATLIKFFPIDKGAFYIEDDDDDYTPRYYLDLSDYHPFINVWKALELILGGFSIVSSLESLFLKLYFAGSIVEDENLSYIKEENDFIIKLISTELTFSNTSTPSDCSLLYYWADDGYYVSTDGVIAEVMFAKYFTPTATCTVQFNLNIDYTAHIASNGAYMDTLTFGPSEELHKFSPLDSTSAADAFTTGAEMEVGKRYFICLEFEDVSKYSGMQLCFLYNKHGAGYNQYDAIEYLIMDLQNDKEYAFIYVDFDTLGVNDSFYSYISLYNYPIKLRKQTTTTSVTFYNIEDLDDVNMQIVPVDDDNIMKFEKEIASVVHRCLQGESYRLYTALSSSYTYPSDESGKVTIGDSFELYPTFGSSLAYGTDVSIADVGGKDTQLDLMKSLRSMYNLIFYTNPLTKTVYIEPRTSFYDLTKACDWRGKIDYSQEFEIEELGEDIGISLTLNYSGTTNVIDYYNWKNNTDLGSFKESLLNKVSTDDETEVSVSLFAPFILRDVDSVGMIVPQDQLETEQMEIDDADVNITPIIGYFNGISSRYSGTDLEEYPQYPCLLFQDALNGVNLGFDDVSAAGTILTTKGLNRYYAENIRAYNYGRLITLYVKLQPHDIESMVYPRDEAHRDLRSVYLLEIDGEVIPCTLEEISDYQPNSGRSTKCTFLSDPNIEIKIDSAEPTVITYDNTAISYEDDTLIGY